MKCKDCEHVKMKKVGYVSYRHYCGKKHKLTLSSHNFNKEHPRCPLRKVK